MLPSIPQMPEPRAERLQWDEQASHRRDRPQRPTACHRNHRHELKHRWRMRRSEEGIWCRFLKRVCRFSRNQAIANISEQAVRFQPRNRQAPDLSHPRSTFCLVRERRPESVRRLCRPQTGQRIWSLPPRLEMALGRAMAPRKNIPAHSRADQQPLRERIPKRSHVFS